MKIIKNKKAGEGAERPIGEIIGWIILFALVIFVLFWYGGLGSKIISILKSIF